MKISVNLMQYYSSVKLMPDGIDKLVEKIGAQLGAVEEVIDVGKKYQGIVVAKVVSCQKHAQADKLSVCKIDDGKIVQNVSRDAEGYVEVVCGAPNVREGLLVAWIPPGAIVPSTLNKEPLTIEAREIRGVVSNGMLASLHELGISDDHSGILELSEREVAGPPRPPTPGMSLAEALALDDYVIDIENKMFTHRPDCFGILGVAREVAGIQSLAFASPEWYVKPLPLQTPQSPNLQLEVKNELPQLVPRFMAVAIANVQVKQGPVWLQSYLSRVGIRPINNIVDLTNYFMMLTGQPLHAYDADKLGKKAGGQGLSLETRLSKSGDKLKLLGGKEITFQNDSTIIITANDVPVGIGGVMGGADTEVDTSTKNIVLECATFDMYTIRKTAMELGLFTDAVTRFTKGQSPLQNDRVLAKAAADIQRLAGGEVASAVQDAHGELKPSPPVNVTTGFVNERLGEQLSAEDMAKLLRNVEFLVDAQGEELMVTPPFWRTDIEIPEDVVEEIGRLYGYDHLPLVLPRRDLTPAKRDKLLELKSTLRQRLAAAGANELLTYSFVHGNLLDKVGQDKNLAFQLANASSPDLQYYRLSLTPSLLEKIHPNIKAGYNQFALFEFGKTHMKGEMDEAEPEVPNEDNHLALIFVADDKTASQSYEGAAYYQAKKYLDTILPAEGQKLTPLEQFDLTKDEWGAQLCAPYEPKRSGVIVRDDQVWGVVGEFKASVRQALKLPNYSAGFEFVLDIAKKDTATYKALPRFPKVEQDICLKVAADMPYQQLFDFVQDELSKTQPKKTLSKLDPVDIYQREDDKAHRQITLRLSIASYERTLTDDEVNKLLDQVAAAAKQKLGAERI